MKSTLLARRRVLVAVGLLGAIGAAAPAAGQEPTGLRVAALFADHMVLQRNQPLPVWGWAPQGARVVVKLGDATATAVATGPDGRWTATLPAMPAGGPMTMTISDVSNAVGQTLTVQDILVGEVWVCSGQSNMVWRLELTDGASQAIEAASDDALRVFTVAQACRPDGPAMDCRGAWTPSTPRTAAKSSAVAWYFGRRLRAELDVPVGLIVTAVGGTPAESWTSREALATHAPSDEFARWWERRAAQWDEQAETARYQQQVAQYEQRLAAFEAAATQPATAPAEGATQPARPAPPRRPENPLTSPWHPSTLYNGMVAPLIPYGIRGAIWYQGESNAGRADAYHGLFTTMIRDWRHRWGQGDFPFYFVQLAAYGQPGQTAWAWLREAQTRTLAEPNTGMAVTIDIGDPANIHPGNKRDVGDRLALWALAGTYGRTLVYSGPLYASMAVEGAAVRLRFDHDAGGLTTSDGRAPGEFLIAGADQAFVPARARIEGRTVVVWSDEVPQPQAVRYAWASAPRQANLTNQAGLPASPFRTDQWPQTKDPQ